MAADYLKSPVETPDPWVADRVATVQERALKWLTSPHLGALIHAFGGPTVSDDKASLQELRSWSAKNFDKRQGVERRDSPSAQLTENQQQILIMAARPLGLLGTAAPTATDYDAIVVLAGATTGNRLRTVLANESHRKAPTQLLIGIASRRLLSEHEYGTDPDSRCDGTEWRNLQRMFEEHVDGIQIDAWRDSGGSRDGDELGTITSRGTAVELLIAPDRQGRRATTVEQLEFLAQRIPPDRRRSVMLVTSAIYVPYQFFAAAGVVLRFATRRVEVIGTTTSTEGDPANLAQRIMQEVHAAIEAAIQEGQNRGSESMI
jgi:hypothetical protein